MSDEFYKKYRPQKLSELVGQEDVVRTVRGFRSGGIPHCLLFTGPSGCGKTTTARILQRMLKCSDHDFTELNIADVRGIDTARGIRDRMHLSPIGGKCRIWLLDEAARATVDSQNAFLKMFEDTPDHVYFFLATTEPHKLLATIKTRATEIAVRLLNNKEMMGLITDVVAKEEVSLDAEVLEKLTEAAGGSPRKGLVLLNQVIGMASAEEQLGTVVAGSGSAKAFDLARLLINPRTQWSAVVAALKIIQDEPETTRRVVLGYCNTVMLGGGKLAPRAYELVDIFARNFYDSGKTGLTAACWEAVKQ